MDEMNGTFRYFLASSSGTSPRWISVVQGLLLIAWLGFSWWIFAGRGSHGLQAAYYGYHGIYAPEIAMRVAVLPNWSLVTLALGALCVWLQALWARCRWSVRPEGGGWVWTGRTGPAQVQGVVPTPGGCWVRDSRRWFYVPRGLVNPQGAEWVKTVAEGSPRRLSPLVFLSPLLFLLVALLACAWAVQAPVRSYRETRRAVVSAIWSRDTGRAERLLARHPEFRPWARYVASLSACDRAECMRDVIRDRLEVMSLGPSYRGDQATLARLLILSGRSRLLLQLRGTTSASAFEVAVRNGEPERARRIFEANPRLQRRKGTLMYALLLLEEGRVEDSYRNAEAFHQGDTARGLALRGVLASLTERCDVARDAAASLLRPESLTQARLEGPGSSYGLGTLQRAAQRVVAKSSGAVAMQLLGDPEAARKAWKESVALAEEAGLPGLLQVDAILLRCLDPGGPWGGWRAGPPARRLSPPPKPQGEV